MDQMYGNMLAAAWKRLSGKQFCNDSRCGDVCAKGDILQLDSLGREITAELSKKTVGGALGEWHELVILHYLDLADGTELSGTLIPFSAQKDGLIRGGGFDRRAEEKLAEMLDGCSEEKLKSVFWDIGAKLEHSNADICAVFPFLPCYPITLKMWFADDEFSASCRLFLDASAEHYLTVEDSVTAGEILLEELSNNLKCKNRSE